MGNIPTTSTTLLRDVANDSQHVRWGEFVARYRPMMETFLRERFPSVEADDVIQETFLALWKVLPSYHYEPDEKGHFRNYLTGILRNKALRQLRKERKEAVVADELRRAGSIAPCQAETGTHSAITESGRARRPATAEVGRAGSPLPAADDESSWREAIFEIALHLFLADKSVADRTKRIFERTALNGESPETVAAAFKMTRHAVDQAKSRAMARLRTLVKELESIADG